MYIYMYAYVFYIYIYVYFDVYMYIYIYIYTYIYIEIYNVGPRKQMVAAWRRQLAAREHAWGMEDRDEDAAELAFQQVLSLPSCVPIGSEPPSSQSSRF